MRRITAKGIIEHYDTPSGRFSGVIESRARIAMEAMCEFVGPKQWSLTLGKFYDKRTTGDNSQNHHIWGHCQQIAVAKGIDIETVHEMAKLQAISWGYPFDTFDMVVHGKRQIIKVPWSETRINTKQAGILIECIHWMASEMEVELYEGEEE
jgi:hypothetical protein